MSRQPLYEVFVSFRGADMRRGITDFLYTMLIDVGISIFGDEEELEIGEEIHPQLIRKIEQCKISLPIISEKYASSKSCLMVLKQVLQCMDKKNHIIIPIFYYVHPTDVRHCRGPLAWALPEHQKRNGDGSFLYHWVSAFHRIRKLDGHHLHEKIVV
ncbi:TMV resistance protein N-like [Eucalyptus grandis]|uniref:TMV resistance protein N-like n=1 Tax=Eucalyptus grandis TaxID=71139 RepID=UPI00192E99EA|nr:TMV resistance protein N-like [Eucalyptus grandis]